MLSTSGLSSTSGETHTEIQSWVEKIRGREEIELTWGEKKENQKGERIIKPVITLVRKNGYGILDS